MKKDRFDIREWRKSNILSETFIDNSYSIEIDSDSIDVVGAKEIIGPEYEYDNSVASTCTVNFTIDIEYRSWGIKSIIVLAQKVSGSVIITAYTAQDEEKEFTIELDGFDVETDITVDSDTIRISHLEIDVLNKKILCT